MRVVTVGVIVTSWRDLLGSHLILCLSNFLLGTFLLFFLLPVAVTGRAKSEKIWLPGYGLTGSAVFYPLTPHSSNTVNASDHHNFVTLADTTYRYLFKLLSRVHSICFFTG